MVSCSGHKSCLKICIGQHSITTFGHAKTTKTYTTNFMFVLRFASKHFTNQHALHPQCFWRPQCGCHIIIPITLSTCWMFFLKINHVGGGAQFSKSMLCKVDLALSCYFLPLSSQPTFQLINGVPSRIIILMENLNIQSIN